MCRRLFLTMLVAGLACTLARADSERIRHIDSGNWYQRFDTPRTWHEAADDCESRGAHLVTISSAEEDQFVFDNFVRLVAWPWLGGTDEGDEGNWRWITGEPWDYSNWNPNEPNNSWGTEHYLAYFSSTTFGWNDLPDGPQSYVCEWEFMTVTFEDGSARYPAGSFACGEPSDTSDPLGPFRYPPRSVCYRANGTGGKELVYRYRVDFAEEVHVLSVVIEGAAWLRSRIRLMDENFNDLARTYVSSEVDNSWRSISLTASGAIGRTFYLEEWNGDGIWRWREDIGFTFAGELFENETHAFIESAAVLGEITTIDFEALPDGTPLFDGDAIAGDEWAALGVTFEGPNDPLKICGPAFWQPTNSLSTGPCPFDSSGPNEDDLIIRFDPPVFAAGLEIVDNAGGPNESVSFFDSEGGLIERLDYLSFSSIGLVSPDSPIAEIRIEEEANDGDGISYDHVRFISPRIIETIAGGYEIQGVPATEAPLREWGGAVKTPSGEILLSNFTTILRIDESGRAFTIAGVGSQSSSGDGGPATEASIRTNGGAVLDAGGNIYFPDDFHRVRKIDTNGVISTVAGIGVSGYSGDGGPATRARLGSPQGIDLDAAGNLFIADTTNSVVRRVDTEGIITTVAGSGSYGHSGDGGPATAADMTVVWDVEVDSQGNIYVADGDSAVVRKVDTEGIITTVAGIPWDWGDTGDGGPATEATMFYPFAVAIDSNDELYIADWGASRVRRVDSEGTIDTVAGDGTYGFSGDGGPATSASLSGIGHVWLDEDDNLYIYDGWFNRRLRRVDPSGTIETIAGKGDFFFGEGEAALDGAFDPRGMHLDADGNLYIADGYNGRVRVVDPDNVVTTLAGTGEIGYGGDGGPARNALLNYPTDVFVHAGEVYIADRQDNRVRKVGVDGDITTVAGDGSWGYGGDGGPATASQLARPTGITVDAEGHLYIADSRNHRVRKVGGDGIITTVAGDGTEGYGGDGGPATSAQLSWPEGVAVDAEGNLYIADRLNHRVRKVDTSGVITTVAGTGIVGHYGDGGPATSAPLYHPREVFLDGEGNLYIVGIEFSSIRKVDGNGVITTVVGTVNGYGGDGGPATMAALSFPADGAVDQHGSLYISEAGNGRIRKVTTQAPTPPPPPPEIPLEEVAEEAPGLAANSKTGASVSGLGDLDGDGLNDFIAGAPGYTEDGGPAEGGAALIYLGSTNEEERTSPDIIFVGDNAHDRAGVAVAGDFDFNGDLVNDFVIGAEQVDRTDPDNPVIVGNGLTYLVYFDPTDTDHYPNLNDPLTEDRVSLSLVGQPGGIPGVVFTGESLGDQAGFALAGGGMVNPGAGHDIAIGAPGRDTAGGGDAGAVYVVFDDPALGGTISLAQVADEVAGVVYEGAAEGDALGYSVDFPGDVVSPAGEDVAMGAPLVDPPAPSGVDAPVPNAGAAYLGAAGTLGKGIIEVGSIGTTSDGAQIHGDQPGEQLGYDVSGGGDNLQNGEADFLVGAPFYDREVEGTMAGLEDAGRAAHTAGVLGRGIIEVGEIGTLPPTRGAIEGAIYVGESAGDRLGTAVAGLGDVTDDGSDDIGLGAPFTDPDGLTDAGTVYVVEGYGDPGLDEPLSRGIIEVGQIGSTVPGRQLNGTQEGENAGTSLSKTGDIDGDDSDDFVAGSPGKDQEEEEDAGSVSLVLESEELSVTPTNQPPFADAGATQSSWECEGGGQAMVMLDASLCSDPDSSPGTHDDIVRFEWFEGAVPLGTGVYLSRSLGLGSHSITLEVTDAAGAGDSHTITVTVVDTRDPQGEITGPPAGACVGPDALPVTVIDGFSDDCDASLMRTYDPGPGPSYETHGDHDVTLTVTDGSGNWASDSVAFTIDTVEPTVRILGPEDETILVPSVIPFSVLFHASDDDSAGGDVAHEVITLDECPLFDGRTYGNGDGLLRDEVLLVTHAELCRLSKKCDIGVLDNPVIRVEATDCGGNVGFDAHSFFGSLSLFPGICGN